MRILLLIIALLFAGSAHAQSYGQRAIAITEALKGSALTSQQQMDVALAFAEHYPEFLNCADPANCTNLEYAQCLVESQRAHFKEILRVHGRLGAQRDVQPTIEQAGETAAGVMGE